MGFSQEPYGYGGWRFREDEEKGGQGGRRESVLVKETGGRDRYHEGICEPGEQEIGQRGQ